MVAAATPLARHGNRKSAQRVGKAIRLRCLKQWCFRRFLWYRARALHGESSTGLASFGDGDPFHGRGVLRGAKVGKGVAVGVGDAVELELGVETCACTPTKKATKLTRTHTLTKAIRDPGRALATGRQSRMEFFFIAEGSTKQFV